MSYPIYNINPLRKWPETTPGFEVTESVPGYDVYLQYASIRRPRIEIGYGAVTKLLTGTIVVRKTSDFSIIQQTPVASGTFDGYWRSPFFTGLEPNTEYEVFVPSGVFYFTYYNQVLGQNPAFSYKFKTFPLAGIASWQVDSTPYASDPTLTKVNRTTNLKLNFGRNVNGVLMTPNTHPSTVGIRTTPPSTMTVSLYKYATDQLVETIDLSKTFGVNKVGVQYTSTFGSVTVNFTHSLECGTKYYVLVSDCVYDDFWKTATGSVTNKDQITFTTDQINFCDAGHDYDFQNGYMYIGFDKLVTPGTGVLRIIDETDDVVLNQLPSNDYSLTYYSPSSGRGILYSTINPKVEPNAS